MITVKIYLQEYRLLKYTNSRSEFYDNKKKNINFAEIFNNKSQNYNEEDPFTTVCYGSAIVYEQLSDK